MSLVKKSLHVYRKFFFIGSEGARTLPTFSALPQPPKEAQSLARGMFRVLGAAFVVNLKLPPAFSLLSHPANSVFYIPPIFSPGSELLFWVFPVTVPTRACMNLIISR